MSTSVHVNGERDLLRWGGLAGVLGGALLLFVFVLVGVVGPDPAGLDGPVSRLPEIGAARTLENSLYLVVMALWMVHTVALAVALRGVSLAPALIGSVLGIAGLTILAAGALPHVVTSRLADLYHASGATPQDQAAVALLWQANQGMFDALLATGLVLLSLGLVALGSAMLGAPAFGRKLGGATVVMAMMAIGAASAFVVDPRSPVVVVALLALIVLHLVLGWKVRRLAGAPAIVPAIAPAGRVDLTVAGSAHP